MKKRSIVAVFEFKLVRTEIVDTVRYEHRGLYSTLRMTGYTESFDYMKTFRYYRMKAIEALKPNSELGEKVWEDREGCKILVDEIIDIYPDLNSKGLLPLGTEIWIIDYKTETQHPVEILGYAVKMSGPPCYVVYYGGEIKQWASDSLEFQRTEPYSEEELQEAIRWYHSSVHEMTTRFFKDVKADEHFHYRMRHYR